jgi:hypothetical protein
MKNSLSQTQTPTIHHCQKCGSILVPDEIAMTKKLINRGTTIYYCTDCLAEAFDVKREDIEAKIQYFKEIGCTLFSPAQPMYSHSNI